MHVTPVAWVFTEHRLLVFFVRTVFWCAIDSTALMNESLFMSTLDGCSVNIYNNSGSFLGYVQ